MKHKTSILKAFNPFLDSSGLIRIGSRLLYSDMADETKYPILLPRRDANVEALIRLYHNNEMHGGAKHVLTQLRQRYWILQGLQACKNVVSGCMKCKKLFKKPMQQKMAPLPASRVTSGAPFQDTGLNLAGPIPACDAPTLPRGTSVKTANNF